MRQLSQGGHGGASFIVLTVRITEAMSQQIGDRKSHGYRWLMVDDHSDLDSQRIGDFRFAVVKQRYRNLYAALASAREALPLERVTEHQPKHFCRKRLQRPAQGIGQVEHAPSKEFRPVKHHERRADTADLLFEHPSRDCHFYGSSEP